MLRLLIQHVTEIVVVIDAVGTIRFSNPQLEKVLSLRTEDVVGRNIFDFIHPDDTHRAKLEYSETVRKPGEGVPSELRVRDASGRPPTRMFDTIDVAEKLVPIAYCLLRIHVNGHEHSRPIPAIDPSACN
jgi:PAS domain-containing protein